METGQSREYRSFFLPNGAPTSIKCGIQTTNSFVGKCLQTWEEVRRAGGAKANWTGDKDWVPGPTGYTSWCGLHVDSLNKGPNKVQFNVLSECHRTLTSAEDGEKYVAAPNTLFQQGTAQGTSYCGGLAIGPTFLVEFPLSHPGLTFALTCQ